MKPQNIQDKIAKFSRRDLENRKRCYSGVAEAYDKIRPRYPPSLIHYVIESTHLSPSSRVLEIGCGPGTATTAFSPLGSQIVCLEPNTDFYRMAQHNCALYPKVEIRNVAWEDAQIGNEGFDVVLAANSFHWIPSDISYQNAAIALRRNGYLILLWNMQHQPKFEVFEKLLPVYESHAPELVQFEDRNDQEQIALEFGREVSGSGLFCLLGCKSLEVSTILTSEEYLMLLSTYSSYLTLETDRREILFKEIRKALQDLGNKILLSYLSVAQVAQKL